MEKKTGVYICSGCGIGKAVDVTELEKVAVDECKARICRTSPLLCGSDGVAMIKAGMAENDATLIAACSQRVKSDIFDFGDEALVERVAIRERVAWCHEPGAEQTQALADDYIRMGLAKLTEMETPVPYKLEKCHRAILVVGGGVTGLTSARLVSDAGYKVCLVEKDEKLGGFMNNLWKIAPHNSSSQTLTKNNIADHVKAVENDPDIEVFLNTTIGSVSGGPGDFTVELNNGAGRTIKVGAIVLATGFKPYDMSRLAHLGAGLPDVVDSVTFEKMSAEGAVKRPSDGKAPQRVVFIQCAGSRDENHLPYCSSVCCATSLKQALCVREFNNQATATIIYRDIRTTGLSENFYRHTQEDPGIFFVKGDVEKVERVGGELLVTFENSLLGRKVAVKADMVTLATGMVSSAYDETVVIDKPSAEIQDADREMAGKTEILNLDYRQGPELPALNHGFPDSHFLCFPYETRRTGIYTAGCARHPQDIATAMADSAGAGMKAIQCVRMTEKGEALSPRAKDTSFPEFSLERCTQCKRCTVECPFGAINEDEKGNPIPYPTRCRRCATCMGACPVQIINFKNYSIRMIAAMIKSADIPDETSGKLRALAFICENDALPALDMAAINRVRYNPSVRFISLRCLGSINLQWIADALSSGWDGVLLLGCKSGDDYQCHNIKGSELAEYRMGKVQETLDRLVLEHERIRVESLAINEYQKIPEIINSFMETLESMEPNPYKGF